MIKSPKLRQLADKGFITPEQVAYLEQRLEKKDNVIVAGHKGHGILILMANLMTAIPKGAKIKQVKKIPGDLEGEADYFLLGDLKDQDYSQLLFKLFSKKDGAVLTIKDPDHNYSLMKIVREVAKETKDYSKAYVVVECKKVDEENKVVKITRITSNDSGRLIKEDVF